LKFLSYIAYIGVVQRRATKKAKRLGPVQPGEKAALGKPYCRLPVPKEAYKLDRDFVQGHAMIGQGVMASA